MFTQRIVCQEEPIRPSMAVRRAHGPEGDGKGMAAWMREDGPDPLSRRLAGDLDTIVLKALRKEPDQRYAERVARSYSGLDAYDERLEWLQRAVTLRRRLDREHAPRLAHVEYRESPAAPGTRGLPAGSRSEDPRR